MTAGEDERIRAYREAIRQLRDGRYTVELPADQEDALGELGRGLAALAGAMHTRAREEAQLQMVAEQTGAGFFLPQILDTVYEGFQGLIPYDRIGCALLDRAGPREEWRVVARWARSSAGEMEIQEGYAQPLVGSSLEPILDTGEPRILNDLEEYLKQNPDSDSTRRIVAEGIRSSLTCPLVAQGVPVGFLFFSSQEPHQYEDVHLSTFLRIAQQLSQVVEKSLLFQDLLQVNQRLKEAQEELKYLVRHDSLTGLLNRRAIQERLDEEVARGLRKGRKVGVILADIDHFKEVNDEYGHPAGDLVLKAVARTLAEAMRSFEQVGRWGGEEFLAVLSESDGEGVAVAAERLRAAVAQVEVPVGKGKTSLRVTLSAGCVAAVPEHRGWGEELVQAADDALYQAKEAGRDQVVIAELG